MTPKPPAEPVPSGERVNQTTYLWNPPPVISEVVPMPGVVIDRGELSLTVNGQPRQRSDVDKLIWTIREIIADLSRSYHLQPGDLIYTGTPEGVGPVRPGTRIDGHIAGVGEIVLHIGAAE